MLNLIRNLIGIISYYLVTLNAFWPFWPCSSQKGLSSLLLYVVCMCALLTAETAFGVGSLRAAYCKGFVKAGLVREAREH